MSDYISFECDMRSTTHDIISQLRATRTAIPAMASFAPQDIMSIVLERAIT